MLGKLCAAGIYPFISNNLLSTRIISYLLIVFLGIPLNHTGKAERGLWTLGRQESLQESRQYFCFMETV